MRIATPLASLGCLLALCATLVHAHQPAALARAGLEKRVDPNERIWTRLASEAESTVQELANRLGFESSPAMSHDEDQATLIENSMSNLNLAPAATIHDGRGGGSSALNDALDNRRSSSWTRPYPSMVQVVERYGRQAGEPLASAMVAVRDTIFKMLDSPTESLATETFLRRFRTAAHAYEELFHAYNIRGMWIPALKSRDPDQPPMFLSKVLKPNGVGWPEFDQAVSALKQGYPISKLDALAQETPRALEKSERILGALKFTIEQYESLFRGDPAITTLRELERDLKGFIRGKKSGVGKLASYNRHLHGAASSSGY